MALSLSMFCTMFPPTPLLRRQGGDSCVYMYTPLALKRQPKPLYTILKKGGTNIILTVQSFQMPIDRLVLFQEQERGDRMRGQPHEAGHPAAKHPPDAFVLDGPAQQADEALRVLGAHDARFDHVDGAAYRGRHEAREQRGREVRRQVVLEGRLGEQGAFEAVVAGQLACGHEHGSHAVRPHAPPQAPPAFLPHHADESVYGVFVVPPLVNG